MIDPKTRRSACGKCQSSFGGKADVDKFEQFSKIGKIYYVVRLYMCVTKAYGISYTRSIFPDCLYTVLPLSLSLQNN